MMDSVGNILGKSMLFAAAIVILFVGSFVCMYLNEDQKFNGFCESKGYSMYSDLDNHKNLVSCCSYKTEVILNGEIRERYNDCQLFDYKFKVWDWEWWHDV